jgi:hypothetical protein
MGFFYSKKGKYVRGAISIFLALVMLGTLAVSALLMEGGRLQAARQELEEATIHSALSMLANYNEKLQERFGLLALDDRGANAAAYGEYLRFNSGADSSGVYAGSRISATYSVTGTSYDAMYSLANMDVLKRQILEHQKYRAPAAIASDLLDIDGMISKLLENIPGFEYIEKILDICNAIASLAEAAEKIYELGLSVQVLQNSVGFDKGPVEGFLTGLWQVVDEGIRGRDWNEANPDYKTAHAAFADAVNDKRDFMAENHPPPPYPGPKPTHDLTSLRNTANATQLRFDELEAVLRLLNAVISLGFVDAVGVIDGGEQVNFTNTQNRDALTVIGLNNNSTRDRLMEELNSRIFNLISGDNRMLSFTANNVNTAITVTTTARNEASTENNIAQAAFNTANAEVVAWEAAKKAYDDYHEAISNYNEIIIETRSKLRNTCATLEENLRSYRDKIGEINSAISDISSSLSTLKDDDSGEEIERAETLLSEFRGELERAAERQPNAGITFMHNQIAKLDAFHLDDVTRTYNFDANFPIGEAGRLMFRGIGSSEHSDYFMNKAPLTVFLTGLYVLDMFEKAHQDIIDLINMCKMLFDLFKIIPSFFELNCRVTLRPDTLQILPSRMYGSAGVSTPPNMGDIANLEAMLNDARAVLGSAYYSDIQGLSPVTRLHEADRMTSMIQTLNDVMNAMVRLSTTAVALLNPATGFLVLIFQLRNIITDLITVINGFKTIISDFPLAIQAILSGLFDNFMLNTYAIEMFPNRMTDRDPGDGGKDISKNHNTKNDEIDGYMGYDRSLFPDLSMAHQTFSGAHVEYIINGDHREIMNQITVFNIMFIIRLINNIFNVLTDKDVMSMIGKTYIFAPIVFIIWVLAESNIDMNILIALGGQKLPLIKTKLFLSPEGLMDMGERFVNAINDTRSVNSSGETEVNMGKLSDEDMGTLTYRMHLIMSEVVDIGGLFKMSYKDYLWFLMFITPNDTKLARMADLIQMEMRHANASPDFRMDNANTFIRVESRATFVPILPIISLGEENYDMGSIILRSKKYVGY